jgi:hypothetical protein
MTTFDANASSNAHGNAITSLDLTTLGVGSGSNRALVAQVNYANASMPTPTLNWDNAGTPQAMTEIGSGISNGVNALAQLWGLVAPTSGNKTLRWSNGASVTEVILNAFSVTGAIQTGGIATFSNSTTNTGTSTAPSITISSVSGDMTVDAGTGPEVISAPTKTQLYLDNSGTDTSGWASRADGAASNVHSWTLAGSVAWAEIGCNIVSAGTTPTTRTGGRIPPYLMDAQDEGRFNELDTRNWW